MVYLLRAFGHSPTGTTESARGLSAAQVGNFDLVLTDILMPGIDGYEFARCFRADEALREKKLVAVTALAMVGDRERILAAGFDGYISKPIEPEAFVSHVEEYLPPQLRAQQLVRNTSIVEKSDVRLSKGAKVLVVDDVHVNIAVLRGALEPFGYQVREAYDAPSAMNVCNEEAPDLILCDLHMPGGDGFEFLSQLKANKDLRHIPVLFLSSTAGSTSDKRRALELGALKFLDRPIEPLALLSEVRQALDR